MTSPPKVKRRSITFFPLHEASPTARLELCIDLAIALNQADDDKWGSTSYEVPKEHNDLARKALSNDPLYKEMFGGRTANHHRTRTQDYGAFIMGPDFRVERKSQRSKTFADTTRKMYHRWEPEQRFHEGGVTWRVQGYRVRGKVWRDGEEVRYKNGGARRIVTFSNGMLKRWVRERRLKLIVRHFAVELRRVIAPSAWLARWGYPVDGPTAPRLQAMRKTAMSKRFAQRLASIKAHAKEGYSRAWRHGLYEFIRAREKQPGSKGDVPIPDVVRIARANGDHEIEARWLALIKRGEARRAGNTIFLRARVFEPYASHATLLKVERAVDFALGLIPAP